MAKLYATLETSTGKTVSVSDNGQIIATVYDGNLKAYSVIIEWCNVGDLEEPTMGSIVTTREWRNQPDEKRKEEKTKRAPRCYHCNRATIFESRDGILFCTRPDCGEAQ